MITQKDLFMLDDDISNILRRQSFMMAGKTRKGTDVMTTLSEDESFKEAFQINAYSISGESARFVGVYTAHPDPDLRAVVSRFLDISALPEGTITKSYIHIIDRQKGYSRILFESLRDEFVRREALHLVGFSDEGNARMRRKYLDSDYTNIPSLENITFSHIYEGITNWMFFDYRKW